MGLLAIWGKKLLFPELFDVILYKLDMQKFILKLLKEGETVFWGSCLMKESAKHSARHRRKLLL